MHPEGIGRTEGSGSNGGTQKLRKNPESHREPISFSKSSTFLFLIVVDVPSTARQDPCTPLIGGTGKSEEPETAWKQLFLYQNILSAETFDEGRGTVAPV